MLEIIWWLKTVSLMDVWTIEHVLSWISVWHAVKNKNHKVFKNKMWIDSCDIKTRHFDIVFVLFVAYLWETIEHYLETWLAGGGRILVSMSRILA
jgi:hypothetical protein